MIAEISLGLAGFAGVAVMLGRGPGLWSPADALRIRFLLAAAFSALFASLVATGSDWAGADRATSIRLGAGTLLVGQVYWGLVPARSLRLLEPAERALFDRRLAIVIRVAMYLSWAAQALALSGFAGRAASWLFLYGLLASLSYAALGFVRLLFVRPSTSTDAA